MRDPATYRPARRAQARANLRWKRGLAKAQGNPLSTHNPAPRPIWRTVWPGFYAKDFNPKAKRQIRKVAQ